MKSSLVLLALGVMAVGCDSNVEVQGGSPAGEGGGSAGGPVGGPSGIEGEWSGYVESFMFDDGSDAVSVSLDSVTADAVVGHVTFGASALYAPPSNPDVGYPPGYLGEPQRPLSGFAFSILDGSFDGERLQISLSSHELWKAWCEMQTPIADETNPGMYWCLPNWGYSGNETTCTQPNPDTGEDVVVDCGKLLLCQASPVCTCDAAGCTTYEGADITLDLKIAGAEADGSTTGLDGDLHNVYLQKQ